jgi:hypothetical protein
LLLKTTHAGLSPQVDDSGVELTSQAPAHVTWALSTCVRIVRALDNARSNLPSSDHQTAVAECWESVARSFSARFDPLREELAFELGSARLRVGLRFDSARGWRTDLDLAFARDIADTLRISKTETHGKWDVWTGGELRLGDPEFDAAFVVRGASEERVRELLSAKVRSQLQTLATATDDMVLSHGGLQASIEGVVTDATELTRVLQTLIQLAESLTDRDRKRAPYR